MIKVISNIVKNTELILANHFQSFKQNPIEEKNNNDFPSKTNKKPENMIAGNNTIYRPNFY